MDEIGEPPDREPVSPASPRRTRTWRRRRLIASGVGVLLAIIGGPTCYRLLQTVASAQALMAEVSKLGGHAKVRETGHFLSGGDGSLDVSLEGTNVGDEDVIRLSRMKGFLHVAGLSLAGMRITDRAVEPLANHPRLDFLDLSRTRITDRAMESLARMPRLNQARLSETGLSDEGLSRLQRSGDPLQMRELGLTDTKVTEAKARALTVAWPNTIIIYGPKEARKQSR